MKKVVLSLLFLSLLFSGCSPYVPTSAPVLPVTTAAVTQPTQTAVETRPVATSTAPGETQPHIHSYFGEVVDATCTESGYVKHSCSCGDSFTDAETAPLGHTWSQWQTVVSPTSETEGLQQRSCVRCGAEEEQSLPKTEQGHTHIYTDSAVAPTCTEDGYTYHICACGDSYRDAGQEALGHSWGEWVITEEPTADTEGRQTRTCQRCGATDNQTLDRLPAAHTHDYHKKRVAASCTEGGYTLYTCDCGDSYREETSQPNGHTWGEWTVSLRPTTSANGQVCRVCTVCFAEERCAVEPLQNENGFVIFLWPDSVSPNQKATVGIIGQAGVTYDIDVYYKSGESSAKGLEDKVADENGYISWTWKIGGSTSAGTYRIVVSGGGVSQTIYFTVEE